MLVGIWESACGFFWSFCVFLPIAGDTKKDCLPYISETSGKCSLWAIATWACIKVICVQCQDHFSEKLKTVSDKKLLAIWYKITIIW